ALKTLTPTDGYRDWVVASYSLGRELDALGEPAQARLVIQTFVDNIPPGNTIDLADAKSIYADWWRTQGDSLGWPSVLFEVPRNHGPGEADAFARAADAFNAAANLDKTVNPALVQDKLANAGYARVREGVAASDV